MIPFEEALQKVLNHTYPLSAENISFMDSCGRVLAKDIFSDMDMPPFDKSAVDGYACRLEDIKSNSDSDNYQVLQCIESIPAGKIPKIRIKQGQCSKIMTGGMIPEGADCVVMVEDIEEIDTGLIQIMITKTARNICFKAEDIVCGDKVISGGTIIQPQHIAVLASVGAVNPMVFKKVNVCVLSTGDELVEPDIIPTLSKIRNSNSYQLMSQLLQVGALPHYGGIVADTESALQSAITDNLEENEIVILTGGVSMGDLDYLPKVLKDMGVDIMFRNISIQPGKPTLFGMKGQKYIFGLPGNPVAAFVLFEILVKPFIRKMMGITKPDPLIKLPLGTNFERKKSSRKSMIPVKIIDGTIFPIEYHGSAHIQAYTHADGIISMNIGENLIKKGAPVTVIQLKH